MLLRAHRVTGRQPPLLDSTESYAASDTDTQSDLYVASISPGPPPPGYPRPAGASPLRVSLVPAYQPCSAPNREHGPPLGFASCNPPAQASANLTVGTPDANGQGANSIGYVKFGVRTGDPATGADEADVAMTFSLTDVRVRSTLADYTGQLQSTATVQITDRSNGTGADAATVQALDFPVTVPCAATAGSVGATCQVTTSFDAVLPGVVTEGRRSIWEFERVRVNDGGPDGQAGTAPNDLFATQGIFVPVGPWHGRPPASRVRCRALRLGAGSAGVIGRSVVGRHIRGGAPELRFVASSAFAPSGSRSRPSSSPGGATARSLPSRVGTPGTCPPAPVNAPVSS